VRISIIIHSLLFGGWLLLVAAVIVRVLVRLVELSSSCFCNSNSIRLLDLDVFLFVVALRVVFSVDIVKHSTPTVVDLLCYSLNLGHVI
jgi:hypothetical protein